MRNKHHRTSHKLGKRAFALCLALAVICSCLVPVFATGGIATMDGGFVMDEGFGVGGDDAGFAVDTQEVPASADDAATMEMPASSGDAATMDTPVVDTGDAASTSGPTITTKETEYGTVTEYDWGDSQTTWTGEDAIATPNDHMKEDDAAFGVLPIEYHFWLKQLDSFDFQMLAHDAEMAEMSETEYLALFGSSEQYPIWHMDTIASTDTISNYKFANPTAKDDPAGENHEFAYWYTVDENGVETEFDPYKTYGSETDTTVNVYAKWKDASGDVAQDTTKTEDTAKTESKTVEVSSKAVISETEDEVTITVKGLPENVKSLSVTAMGEGSMDTFYELYAAQNGTMAPLFGFKIAPKDADGNTVQPKGPVTVTISGLPDDIMISELAPFKVLHQVSDTDIETINAFYNNNGTLTFATDSFSPFVIASKNSIESSGIEIVGIEYANASDAIATYSSIQGDVKVPVGATIKLRGNNGKSDYYHYWEVVSGDATLIYNGKSQKTINGQGDNYKLVSLKLNKEGKVQIRHTYGTNKDPSQNGNHDTLDITVVKASENSTYKLYVYTQIPGYSDTSYEDAAQHDSVWNGMAVGTIYMNQAASGNARTIYGSTDITNKLGTEIVVDSAQFPVIPIKQEDGTYKDYYYETDPRRGESDPYYTIDWYRVVVSNGANTGKNGKDGKWDTTENKNKYTSGQYASPITAVSGMQYHLDGVLQFHDEVHINVSYKVQDAGKTGFDLEADYSAVYKTEKDKAVTLKNARRPDKDTLNGSTWTATPLYPQTKKVGKITYQFDGWYTNEACTGNKFDFKNDTITKDTTFYAKYVPISEEADVTITKQVTGLLGDTNKEFEFSATVTNDGENITSQIDAVDENGSKVNLSSFKLKHNQKITLKDVPVGATVTVTEIAPGAHYEVTATGYTDKQNGGNNISFTYITVKSADAVETASETGTEAAMAVMTAVEADDIVVTNHATLDPDTGVLLDTLPYIVILAVVVGGGILLMLRKRRKNDD